ncbi:MAG TPA: hypothetical protein VFO16_14010 [Pseudonocardiaceae bacterium]|nr:hypothetical protein [Pseudonocardiaceae bacterium]
MRLFGHGTQRGAIRCRDTARHAHRLEVRPWADLAGPQVLLVLDDEVPVVLLPLQVGWLRRQLRESVLDAERQCAWLAGRAGTWA